MSAPQEMEAVGIKVAVRMRPKLPREKKEQIVWECNEAGKLLTCRAGKFELVNKRKVSGSRHGPYTRVFDGTSKTEQVHTEVVAPVVQSFLDGYNGCVFAYGQTGSGKTHTLMGSHASDDPDARELGVVQHTVLQVLTKMQKDVTKVWFLRMSYLEIYNEKFKDLLKGSQGVAANNSGTNTKLSVYDHPDLGPTVRNLTEVPITGLDQLHELILKGEARRAVGRTNMNEHSSRSHTMIRLILESTIPRTAADAKDVLHVTTATTATTNEEANDNIAVSQLYMVDLAGSENVKKSGVEGVRFKEATHINQSLHQLTNVILQLAERSHHEYGSYSYTKEKIHYRNSKLTHALSSCLGGNAKTVLICAASPCQNSLSETHSTLTFARRAAQIIHHVIKVQISEENSLMSKHMHDVEQLKNALRDAGGGSEELNKERQALYAQTEEAQQKQLVAEQQALLSAATNADLRALYQATHALAGAFPENIQLATILQERIVGPVHQNVLSPSDGLQELTIICQEHDETMNMMRGNGGGGGGGNGGGNGGGGGGGGDCTETTISYMQVLNTSLDSTAAERSKLSNTTTTSSSSSSSRTTLSRNMSGLLTSSNDLEMMDYNFVRRVTEDLASMFSPWDVEEGSDEINPQVDDQFISKMSEFVVEPLRLGETNGTEAKQILIKICEQQNALKNNHIYTDILNRRLENGVNGKDGGNSVNPEDVDGKGEEEGEEGGKTSSPTKIIARNNSFVRLPSRRQRRDDDRNDRNDEVLNVLGTIQKQLDELDRSVGDSSGLKRIREKSEHREGNMCSVGANECVVS